MMSIYNGVSKFDANGRAWVEAHCALDRVVDETLDYLSGVARTAPKDPRA